MNKYFKTSSFYLCAFLMSKDMELKNIEKENPQRAIFVFKNDQVVERLINIFNFRNKNHIEMNVNFKKTEETIKKLKQLLYD